MSFFGNAASPGFPAGQYSPVPQPQQNYPAGGRPLTQPVGGWLNIDRKSPLAIPVTEELQSVGRRVWFAKGCVVVEIVGLAFAVACRIAAIQVNPSFVLSLRGYLTKYENALSFDSGSQFDILTGFLMIMTLLSIIWKCKMLNWWNMSQDPVTSVFTIGHSFFTLGFFWLLDGGAVLAQMADVPPAATALYGVATLALAFSFYNFALSRGNGKSPTGEHGNGEKGPVNYIDWPTFGIIEQAQTLAMCVGAAQTFFNMFAWILWAGIQRFGRDAVHDTVGPMNDGQDIYAPIILALVFFAGPLLSKLLMNDPLHFLNSALVCACIGFFSIHEIPDPQPAGYTYHRDTAITALVFFGLNLAFGIMGFIELSIRNKIGAFSNGKTLEDKVK